MERVLVLKIIPDDPEEYQELLEDIWEKGIKDYQSALESRVTNLYLRSLSPELD